MIRKSPFSILAPLLPKSDIRYQRWRQSLAKRPPPWNKGHTKLTHPSILKMVNTLTVKRIDNLAGWRDRHQKNRVLAASKLLEKNSDLAFLTGLILGDGNIYKCKRTECLRIVLGTDKPKLIHMAKEVVSKVFRKIPAVAKRKSSNCVDIRLYQNNLSSRLLIPSGARGKLKILLPNWIWSDESMLRHCLRGLFEAEGSFSIHEPTYTYNLSFSNKNISLLNEVEKALMQLGFHPERRENAVRLRKKAEAVYFVELISFRKYNTA